MVLLHRHARLLGGLDVVASVSAELTAILNVWAAQLNGARLRGIIAVGLLVNPEDFTTWWRGLGRPRDGTLKYGGVPVVELATLPRGRARVIVDFTS